MLGVAIGKDHLMPLLMQPGSQMDGNGRFADAPFAICYDNYHNFDATPFLSGWQAVCTSGRHGAGTSERHGGLTFACLDVSLLGRQAGITAWRLDVGAPLRLDGSTLECQDDKASWGHDIMTQICHAGQPDGKPSDRQAVRLSGQQVGWPSGRLSRGNSAYATHREDACPLKCHFRLAISAIAPGCLGCHCCCY